MARPRSVPKLHRHKASGLAVVRLAGKDHYLGRYGTPQAEAAYHRLIAEYLAAGPVTIGGEPVRLRTVAELAAAYLRHVTVYYRRGDRPTSEVACQRAALRYLVRLYADADVESFGPLALKAVRQVMVEADLARSTINAQVGRIRRMFRWGGENELIEPLIYHRLLAVASVAFGRGGRETLPRRPAPRADVEAVLAHVSRQVRDMICLQWCTGMRPGEVLTMRTADLDRQGPIWCYRPIMHKTAHRGRSRAIALGPQAQEILAGWLRPEEPEAPLFQPREAEAERKATLVAGRKARSGVGNHKRPARRPRARPGERYRVDTYRRAIARACRGAGVDVWTPHQLRHAFGTRVEERLGWDAAQAALGHAQPDTTAVYIHRDEKRAADVARVIG